MAETKEERRARIEKEVAERSAARREAYFEAQAKSKAAAEAIAPELPAADAYKYSYAWRQDVAAPTGELKLIKSPNPYYDASTNTIVNPETGERTAATQSMWKGPTTFRAGTTTTATVSTVVNTNDLYASKYAGGYGIDTQGNQYRGAGTVSDPMNINGSPFTGVWQGKTYQNGILKTPTSAVVGTGSGDSTAVVNGGQTTNIDVLKSLLRGLGYTASLIDSSADFLNRLLKDGLDYDNAVAIFLDSKEYTFKNGQKVTSPFYTAYGYLNDGLTVPKTASELFNAVEGYKGVVAKYSLSDKYLSSDSLKKYVKNNVSVSELDERANAARLKAINADKFYTDALQLLGYIKSPTDLTDFFLNPDIGKEKLEQNRSTAAFSAEAVRRAQQGIKFDATRFGEITAGLMGRGLSEEEIGVTAAEGFENIGEQLAPTTKLAQIYERMPASEAVDIQKELEAEQFLGTASQRRKRVKELEERAFQRAPGTTTSSLRGARAGII